MKKRDLRKVTDQEREIIRRDAIRMIKRGDKKTEIALFYGVHANTVRDLWKFYKKEGNEQPRSKASRYCVIRTNVIDFCETVYTPFFHFPVHGCTSE